MKSAIMISIAESDKDIVIERLEARLKTAKATIDGLNKELLEAKEVLNLFATWFKDNGYITNADIKEARAARNIIVLHER